MASLTRSEQLIFDWLFSPAVHLYSQAEREALALHRAQTVEERKAAERAHPRPTFQPGAVSPGAEYEAQREVRRLRAEYRDVPQRTRAELVERLRTLARRGARDYLRTDPWAGIDTNPWRITEAERKRFGLGKFR